MHHADPENLSVLLCRSGQAALIAGYTRPRAIRRHKDWELTQGHIQLARGMQQESADDDCGEPAGLRGHLRSCLVLLHVDGIAQKRTPGDMSGAEGDERIPQSSRQRLQMYALLS